jgi:hypothetical protein
MPAKYTRTHTNRQSSGPLILRDQVTQRELTPKDSVVFSPFHWWLTRTPQDLDRRHIRRIRPALLRTDAVDDCDWLRAATGDPAAAIGVAIRVLKVFGMTNPLTDVVMSAVLCCALEDDNASRVLISSALRRRKKIDPLCHELWLLWRNEPF